MIVVRLKGGMGNQLFQYAFGKRIAAQLGTEVQFDLSALLDRSKKDMVFRNYDLDIFNVNPTFLQDADYLNFIYKLKSSSVGRWQRRRAEKGKTYIKETQFHVMPELLTSPPDDALYDGWWQSERYFEQVGEVLRNDLQFVDALLLESQQLNDQIQTTNAICLNVRRTDFLKTPDLNTTNLDYFLKGARYIAERVESPHFFVFSDDMDWCETNIRLEQPTTYVSHTHKGRKFGNYLRLMSQCDHFIIPNSSFAWWAVWLSGGKDKMVVAPKHWFANSVYDTSDLVKASWVRL
ncbi:MAG: alpha-1,2-fucosyltransferase [Bacteroidota bacterium]